MRPDGRQIEVIGHAGAGGFFPHNSAASLRKAIELGVDRIEVDILIALDEVLILTHDASLIVDGATRETRELALDQLKIVLSGVLTLDEAVEMSGDDFPLLLDIKGRHFSGALIRAIGSSPQGRRMSACGVFARTLRELKRTYPSMKVGLSRGHSITKLPGRPAQRIGGALLSAAQALTLPLQAKWCGSSEVMIYHMMCTKLIVTVCHLAGLRVNVWTVDEPGDICRVLSSGVDGIISNRPDRVMTIMTEKGYSRLAK
ncbi:MAG: glycerophosphodiester phosphodiesterase [Thermomicrobiales bacterium]|jgi:glycerophosphoryl diester phosphodiesterase|nr:glycerophosphodiester phosphodiesterase [Thermomicrobiales bacterium]